MDQQNHLPNYTSVGMIARWQPVHLGHAAVLRALCKHAKQIRVGIGSANVQNARSPFILDEVTEMLHLSLAGFKNYNLIPLPDLNDGPRWREMVITEFGPLEVFFTANPYVHSLLKDDYDIRHPVETVPMDQRVPVTGTEVRLAMARGEDFQHLVPAPVGEYLEKNRLAARFREEFGLETLAMQNQIIE